MRVASKFVLAIVLVLVLIRTFEGILMVRGETARLDAAIERDAELFGRILRSSISNAWMEDGKDRALELIDAMNVGSHPIQLSWIPSEGEGEQGLKSRLDEDSLKMLTSGTTVSMRQRHGDEGEIQHFFVPVGVPGAEGAIHMSERLGDRTRYIWHALFRELVAGGIVLFTSAFAVISLGFFVIGRPLNLLRQRIKRIGEGDLSERLMLRGHDELSTLATGLNEMCTRLQVSLERERSETQKRIAAMEQVRHMDRLTTIGRFSSGIAHELGTPLNVISGRAGMICDGTIPLGSQKIHQHADTIRSQADRMTQIIRHLLDFARQRPPRRVKADVADIVRQVVELVSCLGYEAEVHLETVGEGASHVAEMDPVQIQQVMTNLIDNALQAMPDGGDVVVRVQSTTMESQECIGASAGRFLRITIEDKGAGIDENDLPHIFDPFFTTKDVGHGTGLGLSIAYGIIREHGGWIDVTSSIGEGSCFAVNLPQEDS